MINITSANADLNDSNTLDYNVSYNNYMMETISEVNIKSGHSIVIKKSFL